MTDIVSERQRRVDLWYTLAQQDLNDIEPQRLRELGIYAGAQGIWVDKTHTASAETGPDGVTVGILHTGRHYPDDLSDDGRNLPLSQDTPPSRPRFRGNSGYKERNDPSSADLRRSAWQNIRGSTVA